MAKSLVDRELTHESQQTNIGLQRFRKPAAVCSSLSSLSPLFGVSTVQAKHAKEKFSNKIFKPRETNGISNSNRPVFVNLGRLDSLEEFPRQ